MTDTYVLVDSSAILTWVLKRDGHETIQRFLDAPGVAVLMPDPALTEVIYVARREGNTTRPVDFPEILAGVGFQRVPLEPDDLVSAAELHEMSQANPMPSNRSGRPPATLSLGDALILAVAERMTATRNVVVVTRDQYWQWLAEQGLVNSVAKAF